MNIYDLRKKSIASVAKGLQGIGKTGMVKAMYFLQQVFKVPLDYSFKIYTYGPYDNTVLDYVDVAENDGLVKIEKVQWGNNSYAYNIYPVEGLNLCFDHVDAVNELSEAFNGYSAKKWELSATIIFVCVAFAHKGLAIDEGLLCKRVTSLKPHFERADVSDEYNSLSEKGFIERAQKS